jgi:hypothetical protein
MDGLKRVSFYQHGYFLPDAGETPYFEDARYLLNRYNLDQSRLNLQPRIAVKRPENLASR